MIFWVRRLLAAFRRALPAARPDPYGLAVAKLERGEPAQAAAAFTVLLAGAEGALRVRVLNKRGVAYVRLGRREEAMADFQQALGLDGRFAPAIANVGNLLFEEGEIEEAVVQYEAAIRADESYPLAHRNLAAAYRRLGKYAAAVREMRLANRLEGRLLFRPGPGGLPGSGE